MRARVRSLSGPKAHPLSLNGRAGKGAREGTVGGLVWYLKLGRDLARSCEELTWVWGVCVGGCAGVGLVCSV